MRILLSVVILVVLSALIVVPRSVLAVMEADILEDEVDGLILRRTLTRTGHAFYDDFSSKMADDGGFKGFNIVVNEKLLPQTGSFLWVEVNDTVVYRSFLQRNKDPRGEVDRAVQAVNGFIYRSYMENGGQLEPLEPPTADIY